jgi:hypothetical protein
MDRPDANGGRFTNIETKGLTDGGRAALCRQMDSLREFLRSVRSLRRKPGLAFAIIATLAQGIGSTTAMFSIIDSILLKPLPVIEESKNGEISHGNPPRLNDWSRQLAGIEGATGFYSEWGCGRPKARPSASKPCGHSDRF